MTILVPALLFAIAAGWAAVAVTRYRAATRLVRTGPRVPGEIVDAHRLRRHNGPDSFSPVVRFRTLDGREITTRPGPWQTATSVQGSQVTVIYDEAKPSRIAVDGSGFEATTTRALIHLVVALVACASIAVSAVVVAGALQ